MSIVVGLDVHRAQITYDALNTATGEVATGRITPADRATLRTFLRRWAGEDVEAAVEATTGWRFVVEELQRAGAAVQLAEPADTTAARGPKRRAKTDKRDARHLRDLLIERRLPQAWIAPEHILELRALVRLRKTLVDQRTEWLQRIHAVLFHHGVRLAVARLDRRDAHQQLAALELSPAAQRQITVALAIIAHVNGHLGAARPRPQGVRACPAGLSGADAPLRDRPAGRLRDPGRTWRHSPLLLLAPGRALRRPGYHGARVRCQAPRRAALPPGAARAALGRVRGCRIGVQARLTRSRLPPRAQAARRSQRAVLSVARKLLRRAHHTLRELGDDALAPAA